MSNGKCALLLVVLVVGMGLVAHAQQYGGTLTVALAAWPVTMDGHSTPANAVENFTALMFEKLVALNAEYQVIPQMATSWDVSDDGLTYTFHLREDRVFHDGSVCDAVDVKSTLERWLTVAPRANSLAIAEINVIDQFTLEIVNSSITHFLILLADENEAMAVFPSEVMDAMPGAGDIPDEQLIGTGPYKLVERTMETITLERHEQYVPEDAPTSGWGGARTPYLDRIVYVHVPEAGARIAGLETGEYDFIEGISLADFGRIDSDPDLALDPLWAWMPIACFNVTNPPMDDIWLRRAILAAVDPEECMLAATYGHTEYFDATNASLFFREQTAWANSAADLYWGRNPELAREYVARSDYLGETLAFFTTKDMPGFFESSVALQDQLKRVGINVELVVLEWGTAVARFVKDESWHLFQTALSVRAFPDAYQTLLMSGAGLNTARTGWGNEAIDALFEADKLAVDHETRYKIWEAITVLITTYDSNHVFQGHNYGVNGRQSYVKGTPQGYSMSLMTGVWIEK